jgi:hypothetical protein
MPGLAQFTEFTSLQRSKLRPLLAADIAFELRITDWSKGRFSPRRTVTIIYRIKVYRIEDYE